MVTKEELDMYIKAYSQGTPLISDEEYDILLEEYLKENGGESKRPFTRVKQSESVNDIVGTLPKVYGIRKPMRENQQTYEEWIQRKKLVGDVIMQPKYDGCSVAYDCKTKRYFTRGDFDNGESVDVTDLFESYDLSWIIDRSRFSYRKLSIEDICDSIKFEAIISVELYNKIFKNEYKSARDVVASIITSHDVERAGCITLIPLRFYKDGQQYLNRDYCSFWPIFMFDEFERMEDIITNFLEQNAIHKPRTCDSSIHDEGYKCDGVVISSMVDSKYEELMSDTKVDDETLEKMIDELPMLERGGRFVKIDPDYEVAVKILNLQSKTKLIDVEFQVGTTGRITPVAILEPVEIEGRTITHVTLSTFRRIKQLNLRYNDTVNIMYNIVPYLVSSDNDGDELIQLPKKCPYCNHDLDDRYLTIQCMNPECRSRIIGSIVRYASAMKIYGFSENTINTLYSNGIIKTIPDIYRITPDMISSLPGFGEKSANNIVESIKESATDVNMIRWLGALPFNMISTHTWESIINVLTNYDNSKINQIMFYYLSNDTPTELIDSIQFIAGIGMVKYKNIVDGLMKNWDMMKECAHLISFENPGQLKGLNMSKACLSGTRDKTLIATLKEKNYIVTDKLTNDCDILVIPNKLFKSSKTIKASKMNIPIYTTADFV